MNEDGVIRPVDDNGLQPGEVLLTPKQAATLESMPRAARRSILAFMQTENPHRKRKLRAKILRLAGRQRA